MSINIQVLSIGETQSGDGRNGRKWHRRTFQVFDLDQKVAGNIPVYGEIERLDTFTEGGLYKAVIQNRAGEGGRLVPSIVDLIPQKTASQPSQSAIAPKP